MAELIQKTDTLNQGREKLNEAIKDADKAKLDAGSAVNTSNQAKQIAQTAENKSDYTQQQLDNIIIESGTSDAEVVQARGDYGLLYQRLDHTDALITDIGINVRNYVDSFSDTTEAIRAAEEDAAFYKKPLFFPKGYEFFVSDTIHIRENIDVIMHSPIVYAANDNKPALVIGNRGIVNYAEELILNVKRNTVSDWSDENSIGIQLINCNNTRIIPFQARGFTIGVDALGSGQGFTYCQVFLGNLINNKIGLQISNESYDGKIGWSNEWTYFGGRFSCLSDVGVGLDRIGIRVVSKDGTNLFNNNNTGYGQNFELNQSMAGSGEALPILVENGGSNRFYDYRDEGNGPYTARITGSSRHNYFSVGYIDVNKVPKLDDRTIYPSNYLEDTRESITFKELSREVFNSGKMRDIANVYDSSGTLFIPGIAVGNTANQTDYLSRGGIQPFGSDAIELADSAGIGIYVDTKEVKKFILNKDVLPGYEGRTFIMCYDGSGNIMAEGAEPLVKTNSSNHPVTYDSVNKLFGGGYRNVNNENDISFFRVADSVKFIRIMIIRRGVENPLRIRSFSIMGLGKGQTTTWTGMEKQINVRESYAVIAPEAGSNPRGKIVYNANAAVGEPVGWISTGASGTFKPFGRIET